MPPRIIHIPLSGGDSKAQAKILSRSEMTTPRTTYKIRRRTAVDNASLKQVIDFEVGDRFKLSALGSQRCPRFASKVGIIAAIIQNSRTVSVRFDGNKRSLN